MIQELISTGLRSSPGPELLPPHPEVIISVSCWPQVLAQAGLQCLHRAIDDKGAREYFSLASLSPFPEAVGAGLGHGG